MLGSLLDKLGSLFSKSFVVGSIPLLAFLLLHGLMAYRVSYHFQRWVVLYVLVPDVNQAAILSVALLIVIVILSYVFSILSVTLREILEGKHLFFKLLSDALSQRYRDGLDIIDKKWDEAKKNRREIRQNQEIWGNTLAQAYQEGNARPTCTYSRSAGLNALLNLMAGNQNITCKEIRIEVDAMAAALRSNSPELLNHAPSTNLDNDQWALRCLISYSADRWDRQYVEYLNRYEFDYAGRNVAATKMGNISNAAAYYAASRYSMNLEVFWSRLQKVLQGDPAFYAVLQDAKMQLDFLVALVWLTLTFTLIWVILLPCLGQATSLFLLIASAGPVLTYIWYLLALQNYRSFSDLLRASVDLYRLDLLKTLHIPLPANAEQERVLWETLERRFGYGERSNIALQNP